MIFKIVTVTRSGRAGNSRPRLQFTGDWLTEMGFVNGALVQSLPEPDGLVLCLRNENINYSELVASTREQGGSLNRAYVSDVRIAGEPIFVTTGKHILKGGFKPGDQLIAKCEYGCIRLRKAGENTLLIITGRGKDFRTGSFSPKVWLWGDEWLSSIGFATDTLVTVAAEPGSLTLTAHDKAVIYSGLVKHARENKMRLIKVSLKEGKANINFSGSLVRTAGFAIGEMLVCEYEYGLIKLQGFEPERFGFCSI
jgi:hypothetical protein